MFVLRAMLEVSPPSTMWEVCLVCLRCIVGLVQRELYTNNKTVYLSLLALIITPRPH